MDIEQLEIFKSLCEVEDAEVHFYIRLKSKSLLNKKIQFVYEHFPPSPSLFPCLINEHKTGSQAEYLFIRYVSDIDSIFEVGPGLVRDLKEKNVNDDFEGFYWEETNHIGFYTIQDSKGKYLYPQIIQHKFAPILTIGEPPVDAKIQKIIGGKTFDIEDHSAAIQKGNKDCVVGMRLEKWPKEVIDAFPMKERLEDLQDVPLFLIPKSHPDSEYGKLEWRLSFSLIEKEILLKLPGYQRKAYLNWKKASSKWKLLRGHTYLLKTVLMKVSYEFNETLQPSSLNIVSFKLKLDEELQKSFKEWHLSNFFLPQQNLFFQAGIQRGSSEISTLITVQKELSCFENQIAKACQNYPFPTFLTINFLLFMKCFDEMLIYYICWKNKINLRQQSLYDFLKAFLRLREMSMLQSEFKSVDFDEIIEYFQCWENFANEMSKEANAFETLVKEMESSFDLTIHKWFGDMILFIKKKIKIDESCSPVSKRKCYDSGETKCEQCIFDLFDLHFKEFITTPILLLRKRFKKHLERMKDIL